jgi:multiple sugar transport system substrate-binding protein
MHGTRSGPRRLITGLALVAILTSACNSAVSPSPTTAQPSSVAAAPSVTAPPALTPAPIDTEQPGPNGGVVVRWFVGLGAGGQPQQFAAEHAFVDKFNTSDAAKK